MNATFRFAVKACLLAAVSGALFNQVVGLFAQDAGTTPNGGSATPAIKQTAATQAAAPQSSSDQGSSEVQKQLQQLYEKNGREMPSMNMDDLPNVQPPAPTAAGPSQGPLPRPAPNPTASPAKAAAPPAAKSQKPNFFERLFHVGRARKQPAATAQPARPAVAPAQPPRYPMPQPQLPPAYPGYRAPMASAAPVPRQPGPLPTQPGVPGTLSAQAGQPAGPALRPGPRSGISPSLIDESDTQDDADSMDLNNDDPSKVANQAPQMLNNQTANGPAASPYSGLTIAPNEMEQKVATTFKPFADDEDSAKPGSEAEKKPLGTEPATLPAANGPAGEFEITRPAGARPIRPKDDDLGMKDDDDDDDDDKDDDDDDETLTLPAEKSAKPVQKPAERALPTLTKTPENPPVAEVAKAFRGYCPVILKDERKLIEARPHLRSEYHGKLYCFSSEDAKDAFDENPQKYVPAEDGNDVVRHAAGKAVVEGTIEHAAWYRGRLYLFSSAETRREFVESPSRFVVRE